MAVFAELISASVPEMEGNLKTNLMMAGCVLCSGMVALAAPLGTGFTYQGQLKFEDRPVNDLCDFQFSLWNAAAAGAQQGALVASNAVPVNNGLFTAALDFGVAVFNGEARWLQLAVRCPAGGGAYTPLSPRQPLTAAPYALQTRGVYVDASQRVGLGTLTPTHTLTLQSPTNLTLRLIGPEGIYGFGGRINFGDGDFAFIEEDLDDQLNFKASRFAFSEGRVGIGTDAPAARLEVISSGETAVSATTNWVGVYGVHQGGGTFPGVWGETDSISVGGTGVRGFATATTGGSYGVYGKSSSPGGLGIFAENTSGGTALAAVGNGSFREQATLRVENTQPSAGMAAYIKSQGTWATMHVENDSTGEVLWLQRSNSDGPFIVAHNSETAQHVFSVSQSGYTRLAVLEITGGADLSEGFDVASLATQSAEGSPDVPLTPQPGMVVSIDESNPGKLIISDTPYDRSVAGIVSGAGGVQPGMRMAQSGSSADGNLPVALSGRVYCRCDTSNGPIRPGDLLTTSSAPGHAMKVTDHDRANGAIIGKAMGSLDDGTGLVLVLVSLQ